MMITGDRRFLYAAAFAAGLAFCTLEVTFVLVATIIVCTFLVRRQLSLDWRLALRAAAVFVATVFIVWPGAILKLSFVKAYLFMAYLAVFRKSPWGNETLLETWLERILNSPIEWIVIACALALFAAKVQIRSRRELYPFLIFAGLMVVATLRVTTGTPRYALPLMPALQVFAGLVIAQQLGQVSRPVRSFAYASAIAVALFVSAWMTVDRHPPGADTRLASVLDLIRGGHLQAGNLLVPQEYLPSIHYYFPGTRIRGYTGDAPTSAELQGSGLSGVFYRADPVRYEPLLK
jgi:4-amino-4-deoxy-L-arabinose transferase-like glycosyltransferase